MTTFTMLVINYSRSKDCCFVNLSYIKGTITHAPSTKLSLVCLLDLKSNVSAHVGSQNLGYTSRITHPPLKVDGITDLTVYQI